MMTVLPHVQATDGKINAISALVHWNQWLTAYISAEGRIIFHAFDWIIYSSISSPSTFLHIKNLPVVTGILMPYAGILFSDL
jgi:hypothetical protein